MFVFHRLWMAASMSLDLLKSMLIFSYDSIHMCVHFHQSLVHNFTVSSNVRINLHKYLHITYEHKRTHITKKKSTTKQTVRAIVYAQFFTSLLSQSWFNLFVLFDWINLHWDFFESFQFKQASCCFMGKKIDTHTLYPIYVQHISFTQYILNVALLPIPFFWRLKKISSNSQYCCTTFSQKANAGKQAFIF